MLLHLDCRYLAAQHRAWMPHAAQQQESLARQQTGRLLVALTAAAVDGGPAARAATSELAGAEAAAPAAVLAATLAATAWLLALLLLPDHLACQ